jgi:hypothetical protein
LMYLKSSLDEGLDDELAVTRSMPGLVMRVYMNN